MCLAGALVALIYVQRIRFAPVEIGWHVFIWGLLVRLLDVLTNQSGIPNGASGLLADAPEALGLVAVAWGLYRYWQLRRMEVEALAYQLKFEHLASELSRGFVSTPPDDLDLQINTALEKIAGAYRLDRISVWWFDDGRSVARCKYSWDRDPVVSPAAMRPADVPWMWSQMINGRTVSFESPEQIPPEAEHERRLFSALGVKSLFCPPLKFGDTTLGACSFVTLRESRVWPRRQRRDLSMLAEIVACAAARSQAHHDLVCRKAEISEQLQFQSFAAELSSTFLTIAESDIDQQVSLAFRRIAGAYQLDRLSLWWFDPEGESSHLSHAWVQSGVPPPRMIPGTDVPWIRSRILAGETVAIDGEEQLPAEAGGEREYFSKTKIQSLLLIPHATGRSGSAASVFSTMRRRPWNEPTIEQLRFLGEVIVSAVVRGRTAQSLRQRDEELEQAQRIAHAGNYAILLDSEQTHFSEELCRILGCKAGEASLERLLSAVQNDDRRRVSGSVRRAIEGETAYEHEYRIMRPDGAVRCVLDRGEIDRDATGRAIRIVGAVLDITERKEAEEALSEALSELEKLRDQLKAENLYLRDEIRVTHGFDKIVGESRSLRRSLRQVEQVAATDSTVLILGETGTGKELIAHSIHDLSRRKYGPLISVNCAALQPTLIEAELFGYEKGAFTGAEARKPGRFEIARGGTLFLDEIGDLPLELQSKLLRVLQDGGYERVGGTTKIRADVRLIAATNRNLEQAVARGQFRADLYYRLNVFPIYLPPLRERRQDIPLLVEHFAGKHARRLGRDVKSVSGRMLERLASLEWPGNVRELENWILRALVASEGPTLDFEVEEQQLALKRAPDDESTAATASQLKDVERGHILKTLEAAAWVIEGEHGAASRLGLNPSTLRSRMRKLGIKRSGERSRSRGATS